jgi:SAM-dependent methyltransferase
MAEHWDSYWEKDENLDYWQKPADSVIGLTNSLKKPPVRDVLDLGCGIGRHALYFAQAGFKVTAVDSSAQALAVLRDQADRKRLDIDIRQDDYLQDLFPANSFDLVLSYNVIYHGYRETLIKAIDQVYSWLRPQGIFFFTGPTRQDAKYGNGEKVAPDTYRPLNSVTPGDIHYFMDENDISGFLARFQHFTKGVDEHYWDNQGVHQFSSYWQITAWK